MVALLALLARSDLRSRWPPMLLTVVVVACATATATVAREVGDLADAPWERTFAAGNGAHVLGIGGPNASWQPVTSAPGVRAAAGPYATAFVELRTGKDRAPALVRELPPRAPTVDRPMLTAGRWPRAGEVLVERSLAEALNVRVGDRVRLGAAAARVAAVAVTSSHDAFPESQPGLVLAPRPTLEAAAPAPAVRGSTVALRLDEPAAAPEFASRAAKLTRGAAHFQPWQKRRADARADTRTNQVVLSFFTLFLLLVSAAVVATLVSARVIERARTVATLAAIGCTPRQATAAFAVEQVAVGVVGVALGTMAGTLLTPQFVARSSALLGAPAETSLAPLSTLAAGCVALAFVAAVATGAAWRAGRGAVTDGLRGLRRGRARASRVLQLSERLGLPPTVGLAARDALAPRGRAALATTALALTVATAVAVLAMEATLDASQTTSARSPAALPSATGAAALPAPYTPDTATGSAARLRSVVYGLAAALLAVGLANLLATALMSVRERTRDIALLRALGASAREVTAIQVGAQAMAGALAAAIGIPLGLIAFRLAYVADNGSASGAAWPPAWQLLLLVPTATAVVALACLPAAALTGRVRPAAGLHAARE